MESSGYNSAARVQRVEGAADRFLKASSIGLPPRKNRSHPMDCRLRRCSAIQGITFFERADLPWPPRSFNPASGLDSNLQPFLAHGLVVREVARRAFENDTSLAHHVEAVRERPHDGERLFAETGSPSAPRDETSQDPLQLR